jgi:hypothetical protein
MRTKETQIIRRLTPKKLMEKGIKKASLLGAKVIAR